MARTWKIKINGGWPVRVVDTVTPYDGEGHKQLFLWYAQP
jgi:hypothetical protein